jgi:hypothetical protein
MPFSVDLIRKLEAVEPRLREVLLALLEEVEKSREESVTKKEFLEFAKRTEENFERVWQVIGELAQAQKRTEQRLEELAQAQKRTEERLEELIGEHKKTREQLGGLSHTVGYFLEDRSYRFLPLLLKRDHGLEVTEKLKRNYVTVKGRDIEVNIIGKARKGEREVWVLGECKTQLKKAHVDGLLRMVDKLEGALSGRKFPVLVTYQASPPVREYAGQRGVALYFSYELEEPVA